MKQIINPQTLTEEQRKIIIFEHDYNAERAAYDDTTMLDWYLARVQILEWLFGEELFNN